MPDDKHIFEKVPYTIVRNEVFDEVMPKVSYPAWKVLSAIIRATMGWQKLEDQLSYSQLLKRTGIKSRSTLTDAIKELETGDYIVRRAMGNGQEPNAYALNEKYVLLSTSTEDELGNSTGNELPLVREMDSQKKSSKENTTTLSGSTETEKRRALLQHWAMQCYRHVVHNNMKGPLRERWAAFADDEYSGDEEANFQSLKADLLEYMAAGYSEWNIDWFIKWKKRGKPPKWQGGKREAHRRREDRGPDAPDYDAIAKQREEEFARRLGVDA